MLLCKVIEDNGSMKLIKVFIIRGERSLFHHGKAGSCELRVVKDLLGRQGTLRGRVYIEGFCGF